MKQTFIDISEQNRRDVADILESVLCDEFVLYAKTRNYHWNVVGPHFVEYHKIFEEQYDELSDDIDEIAERIRSLGFKAPSTLAEFQKNAQIKEHPGVYPDAAAMVSNLLADHETVIRTLRKKIPDVGSAHADAGTEDFLVGLMEKHEKTAWMLRSVLE